MKYVPSIAFDEMSGSAKGVTAAKTSGRKYIRNRGYGGSLRTSDQASVKSIFKQLSQSWHSLTNAQILAWNAAANTAQGKSVLGSKAKISGANLYMRLNYWVVYCGGTSLVNPPALTGVEAPASAEVALSSGAMTFTLSAIPSSVTNLKLIILASEGQSNGIAKAYSKAAAFTTPQTPVTTAINIKADYDAKYGTPTDAKPKVFFKYFYVNTATGEKSGELQLAAKMDTRKTITVGLADGCTSDMGSVTGGGTFELGASATIKATAKTGYKFTKWDDNNTSAERTITVTEDHNYKALFEFDTESYATVNLSVPASQVSMGEVKIDDGAYGTSASKIVAKGSQVIISAEPKSSEYVFVAWSDGSEAASRTMTVSENITLKASFQQNL